MRWRELQGAVMADPKYVSRMEAAISEAGSMARMEAGSAVTGSAVTGSRRAVARGRDRHDRTSRGRKLHDGKKRHDNRKHRGRTRCDWKRLYQRDDGYGCYGSRQLGSGGERRYVL